MHTFSSNIPNIANRNCNCKKEKHLKLNSIKQLGLKRISIYRLQTHTHTHLPYVN